MSVSLKFSDSNFLINRYASVGMLKSTQDKLQRQAERDGKIAFFEAQKENLKNMKTSNLEDVVRKLEMLHTYEDAIAAAKQEYNSAQMLHILDEAWERGEKIAEAAEKNKPKTEEERKEEALGTEENKGALLESMEELSEITEEMEEKMTEEMTEEMAEEITEEMTEEMAEEITEDMEEAGINKSYVPMDVRI